MMKTTDKSGVSFFINECVRYGMRKVVCSPGSRNAPLIIAIDEHPKIEAIVIHDERCAAFFAIGMAQQLKEPVAVVCTSGSAMLNYFPAVAEAYYQCIPLVVISADRPVELINQGDGQTIVQKNVYANHIRYNCEIAETLTDENSREEEGSKIKNAFEAALKTWIGPIHFNIPLSEPLYNTITIDKIEANPFLISQDNFEFTEKANSELTRVWNSSKKKLILCGQMPKDGAFFQTLLEVSGDSSVAILVENTANIKDRKFVHCIDRTLAGISIDELNDFKPDLLITFGGAIISKRIKNFLREGQIENHWRVAHEFPEMNTYQQETFSIQCRPVPFLKNLLTLNLKPHLSNYGNHWKQKDFEIQEKLKELMPRLAFSDLKAIETVLDYIPENSNVHMGNSSIVRYCQLFEPISSFNYFSNRGTSGIDGCTSTSSGIARYSDKCNVLITGDISFFYDSNALWNDNMTDNLRIIIINNNGGGIFKVIEGPSTTSQLEKYFEAKHSYNAGHLCKAFDLDYTCASSLDELEGTMASFYENSKNGRPKLLEIITPSELNDQVLKEFFDYINSESF